MTYSLSYHAYVILLRERNTMDYFQPKSIQDLLEMVMTHNFLHGGGVRVACGVCIILILVQNDNNFSSLATPGLHQKLPFPDVQMM